METFTKQTDGLADCHLEISGLTPSTAYSYVVRAVSGDRKSANSQRIRVTTAPPTFDMLAVEALPAMSVTDDSFVARWEEMADAASYELNVFTKSFNEPTSEECDFTGGITALPEGWYTNATATSGMAGTFGSARPSLRLSANNDLLRTRIYDVDVNGITFWAKAAASTEGKLHVMGLINGSWTEIATFEASALTAAAQTLTVDGTTTPAMPYGCRAVQLVFERTSGSMFIDDVTLYYNGATSKRYLPGYETLNVASTSHTVTGLARGTHYFYTVTAISNNGVRSRESNEIETVTGLSSIGNTETLGGAEVLAGDSEVTIANRSETPLHYSVITTSGIVISYGTVNQGTSVRIELPMPGIYLVKVGDEIIKINHTNI